jgi:ParB-like chromosome segregation protein Spo0J
MGDNKPHGIAASVRLTTEEVLNSSDVGDQPVPDDMPSEEADNGEIQSSQPEGIDQNDLKPHPYADMFPLMQDKDFDSLVTSIGKDGLEEPIVTYKGEILDGRNRHAACIEADVEPKFTEYDGTEPLEFVLRKNLHRRHLITSQRSFIAAKMANMNQGERTDLEPSANLQKVSVAEAAKKFNVSARSVETAKVVLASGDDELIADVESGEVSVSAAAKQVTQATTRPSKPNGTPLTKAEEQSKKLLNLWDKTGEEGQALFIEAIGAST